MRSIPAPPLLDSDSEAQLEVDPAPTPAVSRNQLGDPGGGEEMDVDLAPGGAKVGIGKRRKQKAPRPRLPPLFQRKGHIVFRGDKRIDIEELT